MHRALVTAFLICLAHLASAAKLDPDAIAYEDPFTGFRFPQVLGNFMFQRQGQFERVQLGYGVTYVDTTGATATIMVYDMSLSGIQDGTTDPRVQDEFAKIDQAIMAFARQRGYRGATRIDGVQPLSKAWLQANHELVRPDGRSEMTYSFIRGQHGRFVKIRITTQSKGSYARLPMFLLGVSRGIGMMR